MIQRLLDDHKDVISCLAKAFHEVKHLISVSQSECSSEQSAFKAFSYFVFIYFQIFQGLHLTKVFCFDCYKIEISILSFQSL